MSAITPYRPRNEPHTEVPRPQVRPQEPAWRASMPRFPDAGISEVRASDIQRYFGHYPDVGLGNYALVRIRPGEPATWALTTADVAGCVVICARGVDAGGNTVLYLAHHEFPQAGSIDQALKSLCLDNGCDPARVSIYIVGGEEPETDDQGRRIDNEGDEGDAFEAYPYDSLLDDALTYEQLNGVRVPIRPSALDEPATAVVLTQDHVFYCRTGDVSRRGQNISEGEELPELTDAEQDALHALLQARASVAAQPAAHAHARIDSVALAQPADHKRG